MDDQNNTPQDDIKQQSDQPVGGGNLKKEIEPLPAGGTDFSELSKILEQTKEEEQSHEQSGEDSFNSQTQSNQGQNPERTIEAKDAVKKDIQNPSQPTGSKYPMTEEEAEKITSGPLILKNPSDPMLWLALLMVRHYQWLEKQKKEKK